MVSAGSVGFVSSIGLVAVVVSGGFCCSVTGLVSFPVEATVSLDAELGGSSVFLTVSSVEEVVGFEVSVSG